jgi:hypothetical protein
VADDDAVRAMFAEADAAAARFMAGTDEPTDQPVATPVPVQADLDPAGRVDHTGRRLTRIEGECARLAVDPAAVQATGLDGEVTVEDVQRAAVRIYGPSLAAKLDAGRGPGAVAASSARPVHAAAPLASSNPLAAQTLANAPSEYEAAARMAPVPELFHAGPRPAFTASGVDPSVLDQIAWPARHPAARASSAATAYELLQAYPAADPDAVSYALAEYQDDPGNVDYARRMESWLIGGMSPDQVYARAFAHDPRDLDA